MGMRASAFINARRSVLIAAILFLLVCVGSNASPSKGPAFQVTKKMRYLPNYVTIMLGSRASESDVKKLNTRFGSTTAGKSRYMNNVYVLKLPGVGTTPGNTPVDRLISRIKAESCVSVADRVYLRYPTDIPDDPLYPINTFLEYNNYFYIWGQWAYQPHADVLDPTITRNHIFAQGAWDIEKGKSDVAVAVIDTGARVFPLVDDEYQIQRYPHPDLGEYTRVSGPPSPFYTWDYENSRLLPGASFTYYYENIGDERYDEAPSEDINDDVISGHGTHVAGIIAAKTNNTLGVAGLTWRNIKIVPLRVMPDGKDWGIPDVMVADAIMYCIMYNATPGIDHRIDVINLSLGGLGASQVEKTAVAAAVRTGIIVVGAAGNSWGYGLYPPDYPGAFEDAICVGATDEMDKITSFSQHGHSVDIAAPGESILSTVWILSSVDQKAIDDLYSETGEGETTPSKKTTARNQGLPGEDISNFDIWGNGYESWSGTSMSTPMVSAAAALLRSLDVPPEDVKPILYETATPTGVGRPNDTYGWGLLNVEEALKKACIDVKISSPSRGSVVNTSRPRLRIDFRNALKESIRVWIDGILVFGPADESPEITNLDSYYYTLNELAGKTYLLFEYTLDSTPGNIHNIMASAESSKELDVPPPTPFTDEESVDFRVRAQTLSRGWHLFSVPYCFDTEVNPEILLGTDRGVLARWNYANNTSGRYAMYSLDRSRTDAEATFMPPSVQTLKLAYSLDPAFDNEATPPAGVGYWLSVSDSDGIPIPVVENGSTADGAPYAIGLYYGWNMVGDPFIFPVDWSTVVVEYAGMRLSAAEAVENGWLSNWIFRYENAYRKYSWKDVDDAVMIPWEAQWVKVGVHGPDGWPEPDLKLIVPPNAYTGPLQ